MHHLSPVLWWDSWRMRYMTGSRRFRFFDAMSILARRVLDPSGNSPLRMRSSRSRFSSTDRLRYGDSLPGLVGSVAWGAAEGSIFLLGCGCDSMFCFVASVVPAGLAAF